MPQDWKDILGAAMGNLPADTESPDKASEPSTISPTQKGKLNVAVERKGRGGKTATIIYGFNIPDREIEELAASLKKALGCGGSVRDGEILIQGDRAEQVRTLLREKGFKV